MSDNLWTVIITSITGIIVAYIGAQQVSANRKIKEIGTRTERIRYQVENDHDTNFREEQDNRHEENTRLVTELVKAVNGLRQDIRRDRRFFRKSLTAANNRIDELWRVWSNFVKR